MSTKHNIVLSLVCLFLLFALCGCLPEQSVSSGSGWIDLFNGKDLNGWTPKITGHKFGDDPGRIPSSRI